MYVEGVYAVEIVEGEPKHKAYKTADTVVGKTIEAVAHGTVPSNHGDENTTVLLFTDGTAHHYVQPQDE